MSSTVSTPGSLTAPPGVTGGADHEEIDIGAALADVPGRGTPGTGTIAFWPLLGQLAVLGYGGRVGLHHKDMGIALATARDADVPLTMTGLVAQLIASARARGDGALDHSALLRTIEALSGRDN